MAKHLIIGDGTTSTGVEAAGAVGIEKLSATGPTQIVIGDTISDTAQIRFVQGTSDRNIVSPWIYGKDVINFSGKSYSAPASQSSTITVSGAATNTSDVYVSIKIYNTSNGQVDPFDAKTYQIKTNAAGINTAAEIGDNFTGALYSGYSISGSASLSATQSDELPWFVKTVTWDGSSVITLIGYDKGETMQNGQVAQYPTSFNVILAENGDAVGNGGTYTIATGTTASRGYGYGEYIYEMESELMGVGYGYYNRVQLPVTPTSTAAKTTTYDTYNIVATKDGSSASQIHGVDNLIDITVALPAGDADGVIFENKLNGYLVSAGFAPVIL